MKDTFDREIKYMRLSITELCNERCRYCMPVCRAYMPPETALSETHRVACHLMHPKAPKVTRED